MKQTVFLITYTCLILISCKKNDTTITTPSGTDTTAATNAKWIIDNSFNTADTFISCAVKQADGKIILATHNSLRRINQNGTHDATFPATIVSGGEITCLKLQQDGKLLVGGSFSAIGAVSSNAIARINSNGSLDNSFGCDIPAGGVINAIAIQTSGKIIIGGQFRCDYQGVEYTRGNLVRLNSNGTTDETFINYFVAGSYSSVHAVILGINLRTDDSFYVTGYDLGFYNTSVSQEEDHIARLDSDGNMDMTFVTDQVPNSGHGYSFVGDFAAQDISTGKVLIAGNFNSILFRMPPGNNPVNYGPLLWLDNNGVTDRATTYPISLGFIKMIVMMSDNNFFIGGGVPTCALIKNTGIVDTSYNLTYPKGVGSDIIKISNDTILVTGKLSMTPTLTQTIGILRIIKR